MHRLRHGLFVRLYWDEKIKAEKKCKILVLVRYSGSRSSKLFRKGYLDRTQTHQRAIRARLLLDWTSVTNPC